MRTKPTSEQSTEKPYPPSWLDRVADWLETLPLPAWAIYAGVGLFLVLAQVVVLWVDGGLEAKELLPIIAFNSFLTPFAVALIHRLDRQAVEALHSIRPSLEMAAGEFDELCFKISNMPSRPALIAGLAMTAVVILMERVSALPLRYDALEQFPIFAVVYHIVDKSSGFMLGVFVYHTARQLRRVNRVNRQYVRIRVSNVAPAQAFSRVTASTAVGLVIGAYGWMLINPDLLSDPISLFFVAGFTILAAAVFVWPLYGAHRLMVAEKGEALHELNLRFDTVLAEFNQRLVEGDYAATERLSGTIASLEIQQRRLAAIPTWPWRPETARFAFGAIVLPMVLMVLQNLAKQMFG